MIKRFLVFAAGLLLAAASSCGQTESELHKQPPRVPEKVVFAGQTIRFDRSDLYERMDRELIAFTYMHTNSTLLLKKAERIFSQVVPVLRREGVPEDLKYLMAIESNLDPKSVSSAGAAGLWQFTKSTAREYGLEVSAEVDERYNIEKSTKAACDYLKEAYAKYGDWMTWPRATTEGRTASPASSPTRGRRARLTSGWWRRPHAICSGCWPLRCSSRGHPTSDSMCRIRRGTLIILRPRRWR